jgi:hypothetical protein
MFEHDLFGKPLHTFPDHAPGRRFSSETTSASPACGPHEVPRR